VVTVPASGSEDPVLELDLETRYPDVPHTRTVFLDPQEQSDLQST
jgi:hypothetical protein